MAPHPAIYMSLLLLDLMLTNDTERHVLCSRNLTTCALVTMWRLVVSTTNAEPVWLRCGRICHGCA